MVCGIYHPSHMALHRRIFTVPCLPLTWSLHSHTHKHTCTCQPATRRITSKSSFSVQVVFVISTQLTWKLHTPGGTFWPTLTPGQTLYLHESCQNKHKSKVCQPAMSPFYICIASSSAYSWHTQPVAKLTHKHAQLHTHTHASYPYRWTWEYRQQSGIYDKQVITIIIINIICNTVDILQL